jgi:hypothetical protein
MSLRTTLASLATLAVAISFVPVFVFAQSYNYAANCGTNGNNWFPYWNNTTANCAPGNLLVYVQVSSGAGYNNGISPSNFTVSISGQNPSPSSFLGSLSGTPVLVSGGYAVNVSQLSGYSATYSQGCSGTLTGSSSATCIVTESSTGGYNTYPNTYYPNQYYPYSNGNTYYTVPLICSPSGQTVTIGQSMTFTAQGGGDVSQFNWSNSTVPNNTSYNIGRTYTTTFLSPGTATVTVTNGQQIANCIINVVGYPIAGYPYPGSTITPIGGVYPNGSTYPVTVTPTYIPRLPNTGFAPVSASELAFVLAFLIAAALASYPYVRQAFAIVLR